MMASTRDLVVGIDCSTTSTKAIVWDRNGQALAEGRRSFSISTPQPDWREQAASDWWTGTATALRDAVSGVDSGRIAALCITHQRETFVPVDENGEPLRPAILWIDERARPQVERLKQDVGDDKYQRLTGKPVALTPALPKLLWLQDNEPDVLPRAHKILEVHAFLIHRLIGRYRTSWPCADPLGVLDIARHAWSTELLGWCGLREDQFPELVPPGSPIGELNSDAAAACGLPSGLPIIAGAGDGQAAGLGAGITAPGRAYLNLGTAIASGVYSENYVTDLAFRTMGGCIPGTFYAETLLRAGTYTVSWFLDKFARLSAQERSSADTAEGFFEQAAGGLPPGSLGLMLVPYWSSVMNPYWDSGATGIVVGWTGAHERHHLYRAILEGIGFEQRLFDEGRERALGSRVSEYVAMGGGSKSPLWCQIIADITGRRVVTASSAEATSLGAGILAAAGAGLYPDIRTAAAHMAHTDRSYEPNEANRNAYDCLYDQVYRHLFPALRPYIDRLGELTHADAQ